MTASYPNAKPARRWTDQVDLLSQAVDITRYFPGPIQNTLIEVLDDTIAHYRRLRKNHQQSIGVSKILGLFQASKRARWYDAHPRLRRSFNMMALIPAEPLSHFAGQIMAIGKLLDIQQSDIFFTNDIRINSQLAQEAETLLKKTYFTFVQDPQGIRMVHGNPEEQPQAPTGRDGVIIVPSTQHKKRPYSSR